ncbi:hypothetical protein Ait01nite_057570 [Actinoplanes italicus]|uniref:Uncharacterized protein n=1 Tax=Actinoplanes italicus TaxID=113567 RepID=A0A2T0K5R9_9ACTN|nr:hypothetical protein [Actinoplanes italicus]PRX18304.1 hypothetical protein CLV67_113138 [Actinoplanes italicus]GIE32712.1 hypothetical protein Ait01nite_057570 [Actinoplanes italicus]
MKIVLAVAALTLTAGCTTVPAVGAEPWHSFGAGCPALGGYRSKGDPRALDTAENYRLLCEYTAADGTDLPLSVMIDRETGSSAADFETSAKSARETGLLVLPLAGVGDDAMVVADPAGRLQPATVVHGETVSRNAILYAKVTGPEPVRTEADVTARAPVLAAVLNEALENLKTR